ncbi:MAG: ATP-grasp domain-containing protein [Planctomycetia bacterium]
MAHQDSDPATARRRLVVLGASARALAESSSASGWEVHAADLFGDLDLRAVATAVTRVPPGGGYPAGLATAAEAFPPGPWCYTGAIENHADLIDSIAATRPLAGTPTSAVRSVRDPAQLAASLRAAGLHFPETLPTPDGLPTDGSFLVKPLASAAGRGIRPWTQAASHRGHGPSMAGHVWQRRVVGTPHAAAFIIGRGTTRLIGLTRQLIGEPWCHAGPFGYCGSIVVPEPSIPAGIADQLACLGALLAETHGCVGAVGVDLVIDDDGSPWVIEVNPRYTASMEVHERSTGESVAGAHLHACGVAGAEPPRQRSAGRPIWAKAVLHAPRAIDVTISLVEAWRATASTWSAADGGPPAIADIPAPGQSIPTGAPLLTVFAGDHDAASALATIQRRAAHILSLCDGGLSPPSAEARSPSRPATSIA